MKQTTARQGCGCASRNGASKCAPTYIPEGAPGASIEINSAHSMKHEKHRSITVATDPVCGMQVDPSTSKHVLEHEGKRVAFCSAGCLAKFKADPKKYLEKPAAKPAACCGGHAHAHGQAPA